MNPLCPLIFLSQSFEFCLCPDILGFHYVCSFLFTVKIFPRVDLSVSVVLSVSQSLSVGLFVSSSVAQCRGLSVFLSVSGFCPCLWV